jgi:D-sedoheptulose 7-phosphate isomerase
VQGEDVLVAISSSGRSPNILNAVEAGRAAGCAVITLSGFEGSNPLRQRGDMNFHVPSTSYGVVEITHLTILHAILEVRMTSRPALAAGGPIRR